MRDYIDAAAFKEMILCADAALNSQIQKINELNVFPVPDGDTGTNMGLTLNNAAAELRKIEVSLTQLPRAMDQTGKKLEEIVSAVDNQKK